MLDLLEDYLRHFELFFFQTMDNVCKRLDLASDMGIVMIYKLGILRIVADLFTKLLGKRAEGEKDLTGNLIKPG